MSMAEMSRRRRRPRSPATAPPLEDDNLLSEILLRLPPEPSSLPRASLVSKRWLGLVSDHAFLRRFRLHHRNPPLLGFFHHLDSIPTVEPPNRLSDERLPWCADGPDDVITNGCRHGLVLVFNKSQNQVLVRDPFNGDEHRLTVPMGFDVNKAPISGAVFRVAEDTQHFQVVLVGAETDKQLRARAIARVYSSETGVWGDCISTPFPSNASTDQLPAKIKMRFTISVLVEHYLYWLFTDRLTPRDRLDGILEFDLERQILAVIPVPMDIVGNLLSQSHVMRAEGGGLGIIFLSEFNAQLWKMETDSNGVASWVLGRIIKLDKLLSMDPDMNKTEPLIIRGFAECNNVVLIRTPTGLFTIQLESLQFKKVCTSKFLTRYHPFESVCAADNSIFLNILGSPKRGKSKAVEITIDWGAIFNTTGL